MISIYASRDGAVDVVPVRTLVSTPGTEIPHPLPFLLLFLETGSHYGLELRNPMFFAS